MELVCVRPEHRTSKKVRECVWDTIAGRGRGQLLVLAHPLPCNTTQDLPVGLSGVLAAQLRVWQREDQTVCRDEQNNRSPKEDAGWVRGFF